VVTVHHGDHRSDGDMEARMEIVEQLTALSLLIVFLFGITCGVVGGAVHGSRRGALLVPASDDLLSVGARVIYGVYARDDDGYLQSPLPGYDQTSSDPRGNDGFESHGQEVDR
jgi:hypothetical protein